MDIETWNKATILKMLWNLANKKDKLWVIWVHAYFIKGKKPFDVQTNQASLVVKKKLQGSKWLEDARMNTKEILQADKYNIKKYITS